MDLELSDDQRALKDGIAALCEGRFDRDAVRSTIDAGLDRRRWSELADTGVFALWLPEDVGGVGLGFAEAVVVFEELGRHLVPGPLVATTLAAAHVPGARTGESVVGVVDGRGPGPVPVAHLGDLDLLVVVDDGGLELVETDGMTGRRAANPLDPLTPVWWVDEIPDGETLGGPDEARRWRVRSRVLTSALQLGLAVGATELAVRHALERHQFGRPIGAFQAVKHRCADMATRVEVLRAAVYAAGVVLDDPRHPEPDRAAAVAAIVAARTAAACGRDCVQVHGGMGYTWEADAHLFLKRSWVHDTELGDLDAAAESLAASLVAADRAPAAGGPPDPRDTP